MVNITEIAKSTAITYSITTTAMPMDFPNRMNGIYDYGYYDYALYDTAAYLFHEQWYVYDTLTTNYVRPEYTKIFIYSYDGNYGVPRIGRIGHVSPVVCKSTNYLNGYNTTKIPA